MSTAKLTFFEQLHQALQSVEDGYDLLAPKFDQSRYITPETILQPFFKKLQSEKGPFDSGIDICCGTGAATVHLAKLCQKELVALDLSQGMLDQCQQKLTQLPTKSTTTFVKANALEMPFNNQFDVAVCFGAFGHILEQDEPLFIAQIHKILKPGGHFYFITTEALPFWSLSFLRQKLFNGILRIRNFFIRPKFIMYYLTFRLPEVQIKLEKGGFEVRILEDFRFENAHQKLTDLFPAKYFKMVVAEKKSDVRSKI